MVRRLAFAFTLALALTVAFAFAPLAKPAHANEVVRLGNLKFAHYGAISFMKEHCKKYGLDVQETVFPKGIDIFPAIVKGEVDIAASAADAAIANRAGGGQVYVVAGFAKGGARLVSRSDLPLKKVAELKGKKVGVARGGAQELLLLAELAKAGLTWSDKEGKDVQIVYMAFADLNQALLQKQIDAMCQSEPQSSQAINKGFGLEMLKPYDTPLGEPVRVMVMTEKLYQEKPAVAKKVLELLRGRHPLLHSEPQGGGEVRGRADVQGPDHRRRLPGRDRQLALHLRRHRRPHPTHHRPHGEVRSG